MNLFAMTCRGRWVANRALGSGLARSRVRGLTATRLARRPGGDPHLMIRRLLQQFTGGSGRGGRAGAGSRGGRGGGGAGARIGAAVERFLRGRR